MRCRAAFSRRLPRRSADGCHGGSAGSGCLAARYRQGRDAGVHGEARRAGEAHGTGRLTEQASGREGAAAGQREQLGRELGGAPCDLAPRAAISAESARQRSVSSRAMRTCTPSGSASAASRRASQQQARWAISPRTSPVAASRTTTVGRFLCGSTPSIIMSRPFRTHLRSGGTADGPALRGILCETPIRSRRRTSRQAAGDASGCWSAPSDDSNP